MYVIGQPVRGGHYGARPSLKALDADDNLQHTTDFRRVYATLIEGWLGGDAQAVLRGRFEPFPMFPMPAPQAATAAAWPAGTWPAGPRNRA